MMIRRFRREDAERVSELITTTMRISNAKDYPPEDIDALVATQTPEHILRRAEWTHFYVAEDAGGIIGCGAIGPYWGSVDESCLFSIFVHPGHQGRGVGRRIIETLERDPFFLRAWRTEVPASVTGVPFYMKMGYRYKNGITEPDEERLVRLEKRRERPE